MSSFGVSLDHELHLVRITASGTLYQKDGEKIITTARTAAAENNFNVLYDIRHATAVVSFASWFKLPRELDVLKNTKTRNLKAAVLASQNDKAVEEYKFYETVMANVGLNLRVFFN